MPSREAPPMPPKKERGTEMTRAQGQETTRKLSARVMESVQEMAVNRGGRNASATAASTTAGV